MTAARGSHLRLQTTWIALIDVFCLLVGIAAAVAVRIGSEEFNRYLLDFFDGWVAFCGSVLLSNYFAGNYGVQNTYSRFNLVVSWLFSMLVSLLVLSLMSYTGLRIPLGRGVLLLAMGFYSVASLFFKLTVYRHLFRIDMFLCRTLIIGDGQRARSMRGVLEGEWILPAHKVVAYVHVPGRHVNLASGGSQLQDGVVILPLGERSLDEIVRPLGVALIVVALEDSQDPAEFYAQLRRIRFNGIEVLDARHALEMYSARMALEYIDERSMMEIGMESALPIMRRVKRMMDVMVAIAGCIISLPIALLIALAIKLSAPFSPVIYTQDRVGQFGRVFRMYKFRTMRPEAESATGAVWASESDARITGVGRILRRTRMDELPQLLNILRGEMSIVGPRPERPEFVTMLERQIPYYSERANVMPGLTGWAQIRYPYGSSIEDAARKLEYDLFYIRHLSIALDVQIILSTIRIVFFGKERSM